MPPSHHRAITNILACRGAALSSQPWRCGDCGKDVPVYQSCRNRSCPTCHGAQAETCLTKRRAELLPVPHFHVTVTVPAELRVLLCRREREGYGALIKALAGAIVDLCKDPKWVVGSPGVLAVLHTWTLKLDYHPHSHVHCLVTRGGLSMDGRIWHAARCYSLFPTRALAKLVRGRFRAALETCFPDLALPPEIWTKRWGVHITPWRNGPDAVFQYLARYVFRIAITDRRIVTCDRDSITFRYKDRVTSKHRLCTLPGHIFMRRYLQHVLREGFHKVRYFDLWHPTKHEQRQRLVHALLLQQPADAVESESATEQTADRERSDEPRPCRHCPTGTVRHLPPPPLTLLGRSAMIQNPVAMSPPVFLNATAWPHHAAASPIVTTTFHSWRSGAVKGTYILPAMPPRSRSVRTPTSIDVFWWSFRCSSSHHPDGKSP